MNLKKSDKMIAGIAVLVLIVAAVGIVLYSESEDEVEPTTTTGTEYVVEWVKGEGSKVIEETVGKDGYTEAFTLAGTKDCSVITSVSFHITWEDSKMKKGLFNKGEDTLNATISSDDGQTKVHEATGAGNETLTFSLNPKPKDETIDDVKDLDEAKQMISEEYGDMDSANFDIEVSWKQGEQPSLRIGRLINWITDKGEDFKIEITFEYYYPEVHDENVELNDDNKETNKVTVTGPGVYTVTGLGYL